MKHKKRVGVDRETLVYSFAVRIDREQIQTVRDLFFRGNLAYNAFIEIERNSLREYRDARASLSEELREATEAKAVAKTKVEELLSKIKAARSKGRSRGDIGDELRARVNEAKATEKAARLECARISAEMKENPELMAAAERISRCKSAAKAKVRSGMADLYWGVRDVAGESAEMAAKGAIKAAKEGAHFKREPEEVGMASFRCFDGSGRASVIFTNSTPGGVSVTSLFSDERASTMFQMDRLPDGAFVDRNGKSYPVKSLVRTNAKIRIGSEERRPVWLPFTFVQHRPIPSDAMVTKITLVGKRVACKVEYAIQFTLTVAPRAEPAKGAKTMKLSIDRKTLGDGSLQVAIGNGPGLDVVIPRELVERIKHADDINSAFDRILDRAKRVVVDGFDRHGFERGPIDAIKKWKGIRRFAKLSRVMCDAQLPNVRELWGEWLKLRTDTESSKKLELLPDVPVVSKIMGMSEQTAFVFWTVLAVKKMKHVESWKENQRRKALACRKHLFRNYAARLRDDLGFGFCEFEQPRLVRTKPKTEDDMAHLRAAQRMHDACGASELKLAIVNAFGRNNVKVIARSDERAVNKAECEQ